MPKISDLPKTLKPYIHHGLDLHINSNGREALGTCPFCGREKFSVNIETEVYKCWGCLKGSDRGGGNRYTFFNDLYEIAKDKGDPNTYKKLAKEKGLTSRKTLSKWGVCISPITDEWMLPGYNPQGNINQLYRYTSQYIKDGKRRMIATPDTPHGLWGMNLWNKEADKVYVTEGVFDAMILWETLSFTKMEQKGEGDNEETLLDFTTDIAESMLSISNVIGLPGCNVFNEKWADLFAGKIVILMFDNDYPRKNPQTEETTEPASYAGMKRISGILSNSLNPPKEIHYLSWHPASHSYDASRPDGYDLRDCFSQEDSYDGRIDKLAEIMQMCRPIPESWGVKSRKIPGAEGNWGLTSCSSWIDLVTLWKKALKWADGYDITLSVMLAAIASTDLIGDQLWVRVISAPGTGKTALCQALETNKRYIKGVSIFTGFHSGWKEKGSDPSKDHSLISQLRGKCMTTKDGDTLLQQPNLLQIMSQARELYDGSTQSYYRNNTGKDHSAVRFSWIICGTMSLYRLDNSELGERYLTCKIMDKVDHELEDEILWRKVNQVYRNRGTMVNGKIEDYYDKDLSIAMAMTGGYISWLRQNADRILPTIEMSEESLRQCMNYAKFASYLRSRPGRIQQDEDIEKELSTRLLSQLCKLATCLALVLNKQFVDKEVMRRVKKVTVDTSRGNSLRVCQCLFRLGAKGEDTKGLAARLNWGEEKLKTLLYHMLKIEALQLVKTEVAPGIRGESRWRMTPRLCNLYKEIFIDGNQ